MAATNKSASPENGTVAVPPRVFSDNDFRSMESFDDAMRLVLERLNGAIYTADAELGDGFELLSDKNRLVGIPLMFVSWDFHAGDFGEFVSAHVVAKIGNGIRVILNDGSTGIYAQLRDFTDSHGGIRAGLVARHGLRRSDYHTAEGDPATTFYIDTAA